MTVNPQLWLDTFIGRPHSPSFFCEVCERLFRPTHSRIWASKPLARDLEASGKDSCARCWLVYQGVSAVLPGIETWDHISLHALLVTEHDRGKENTLLRVGAKDYGPVSGEEQPIEWVDYHLNPCLAKSRHLLKSPPLPGSDEWYQKLKSWVSVCDAQHLPCKWPEHSILPKRVLDLDFDETSPDVVLREFEQGYIDRYIALSYSWGREQNMTTTKNTLDSRQSRILWEDLPILFRDVIEIARALSVRFLWVDALCIIQGDGEDWARESPKMADYYGNAWLTIAADHAPGVGHNCFPSNRGPATWLSDVPAGVTSVLIHRLPIHFNMKDLRLERTFPLMPLFNRAWAFQERLLSRRILHLGPEEAVWECSSAAWCECGRPADVWEGTPELDIVPFRKSHHTTLFLPNAERGLDEYWEVLLTKYMVRRLSFDSDRLKAITSLAKAFKESDRMQAAMAAEGGHMRPAQLGNYIYGLWTAMLPSALLWAKLSGKTATRNPKFPTWSWASITGFWYYEEAPPIDSFVSWSTVLEVPDESWDINHQKGFAGSPPPCVVVEGPSVTAKCHCILTTRAMTERGVWVLSGVKADNRLIVNLDIQPHENMTEFSAVCLEIGTSAGYRCTRCWGLLLELSAEFPGHYTRLGVMTASANWFEDNGGVLEEYRVI